jgi:hypothetical protein
MNQNYRLLLATALISISIITIAMELNSMLPSLNRIIMFTAQATSLSHASTRNISNQDKNYIHNNVLNSSPNISPNVRM